MILDNSEMAKSTNKTVLKDMKEFTDEEGKKWIQTSPDDLFTMKEFSELFAERDKQKNDIVLARIDFQNVNREYYETALDLQKKLEKQGKLLKTVTEQSKVIIDRKNAKLKELIEYIRTLHAFIANLNENPGAVNSVALAEPAEPSDEKKTRKSVYADVEEIVIDEEGDIDAQLV